MQHKRVKKAFLKAKSEELKIPFSNLLAGFVLEELMFMIAESPFSQVLLLKNSEIFGTEQYRSGNCLNLEFAYVQDKEPTIGKEFAPGGVISLKLAYIMLAHFIKRETVPEIKWRGRTDTSADEIFMYITGEFAEMTVPVQIHIRVLKGEYERQEKQSFTSFLCEEEKIEYFSYPADMRLTESIYLILSGMELIPEMEPYRSVYHTLKEEIIDARRIAENLSLLVKGGEVELEEERVNEILSYRTYGYMQKRWEKYMRRQKDEMIAWEEVLEVFGHFLSPVWEAVCKDEIFLGDWMPELGRFL